MTTRTTTYRRDELYEQVWQKPVRTVAKEYGVSDVALGKICRRMGIPLPGLGYWAKKAAGHKLPQPPLPPVKPGEPNEVEVKRTLPDHQLTSEAEEQLAKEPKIIVPDALRHPHPLIWESADLIRRAAKPRSKIDLARHRCLDIRGSAQVIDRALRVADAVLKALDERGYPVEVTEPNVVDRRTGYPLSRREPRPSATRVQINAEWVEFGIEEGYDSLLLPPREPPRGRGVYGIPSWTPAPERERRPNGRLRLLIKNAGYGSGHRTLWADGKMQRVENRLNDFIRGLVLFAAHLRQERLEQDRREREWKEAEARREEERRWQAHQARLIYDLDSRVQDWTYAKAICEFLDAVEDDAIQRLGAVDAESELARWVSWGRGRSNALAENAIGTILELRQQPGRF